MPDAYGARPSGNAVKHSPCLWTFQSLLYIDRVWRDSLLNKHTVFLMNTVICTSVGDFARAKSMPVVAGGYSPILYDINAGVRQGSAFSGIFAVYQRPADAWYLWICIQRHSCGELCVKCPCQHWRYQLNVNNGRIVQNVPESWFARGDANRVRFNYVKIHACFYHQNRFTSTSLRLSAIGP